MGTNAPRKRKNGAVTALISILATVAILSLPQVRPLIKMLTGEDARIAEASSGGTLTYHQVTFDLNGIGSVQVTPPGTLITASGPYTFVNGSTVTLQAIPPTGYVFDHWEGGITGSQNPVQVTINSALNIKSFCKPTIYFLSATSSVNESQTTKSITLERPGWGLSSTVYLNLSGSASTNGPYADYSANPSVSVTFPPSIYTTTQTINVTVTNDALDEFDEQAVITLQSSSNAQVGYPNVHTLTILDDDAVPYISFTQASSTAQEGVTTPSVTVGVFTATGTPTMSGRTIVAQLYLTGNAQLGSDFNLSPVEVRILEHTGTKNIDLSLINDDVVESNETATLTMELYPSSALMGSIRTHNLTITDNDLRLHLYKQPSNGGVLSVSPWGVEDTVNLPSPAPNVARIYPKNTSITITAARNSGYALRRWTGSINEEIEVPSSVSVKNITITGHATATAEFEPYYTLTKTVIGGGSVIVNPNRTDFFSGDDLSFTAQWDPEQWRFDTWGGVLAPGNDYPRTFEVGTSNFTVTAKFVAQRRLTTGVVGNGYIEANPVGPLYDVNTPITLTAHEYSGWYFTGWTSIPSNIAENDVNTSDMLLEFEIGQVATCTAHFEQQKDVTVNVNPSGDGLVTLQPLGGSVVDSTTTSMTKQLEPGVYVLKAFSGPQKIFGKYNISGIGDVHQYLYLLTVDGSKVITAYYALPIEINSSVEPPASGWVTIVHNGGGPTGFTENLYPANAPPNFLSEVTLTANALPGYQFIRWGDGLEGVLSRTELVDGGTDAKADAVFDLILPTADFTATPRVVVQGKAVEFEDRSDGNATQIHAWQWHFGDGGEASTQTATHVYDEPGEYTVSLKVTNDGGNHTATKTLYITVLPQIVAHWPFNESATEAVPDIANDDEMHELDLTLDGAQTTQGAAGIIGNALTFAPGASDPAVYDVDSEVSLFDLSSDFTAMVWFKLNDGAANQTLLSKGDPSATETGYEVTINPSENAGKGVMLRYGNGAAPVSVLSDQFVFQPDAWYHLAVVFEDGAVAFYINGNGAGGDDSVPSDSFAPNVSNFIVGGNAAGDKQLNGTLDELVLQRVALEEVDIDAEFGRVVHTLTIDADPAKGAVSVITQPVSGGYTHGQKVEFAVSSEDGYSFTGWGGDNGSEAVQDPNDQTKWSIVMDDDKDIAALFEQDPVIDFTSVATGLEVVFTGSVQSSHNPQDLTWTWDFGDGSTGSGRIANHTYAKEGTFTVTLTATVTGTTVQTTVEHSVEVIGSPKAAIQVEYLETQTPPYRVRLTDVSILGKNQNLQSREWTVPNNSPPGDAQVTVDFTSPGERTVSLRIVQADDQDDTANVPIKIHAVPDASFSISPSGTKYKDHYLTFTDTSSPGDGTINEWRWDFGDGTKAIGIGPHTHVYGAASTYTVTLTVRTQYGSDIETIPITIQSTITLNAPDLTVDSIGEVDANDEFKVGDTISVTASVRNHGSLPCAIGRKDALYISLDDTLDANDLKLDVKTAAQQLAVTASEQVDLASTLLPDIAPGRYFLIVNANDDHVLELSETDNTKTVAITVVDPEMSNE